MTQTNILNRYFVNTFKNRVISSRSGGSSGSGSGSGSSISSSGSSSSSCKVA